MTAAHPPTAPRPAGAVPPRAATGVRLLDPAATRIFEGSFSLLQCQVGGEAPVRGVFAVRMFPIHEPDRFISLRHTGEDDKEKEIGLIGDLQAFPPEARELVRRSLSKQYFEKVITSIEKVEFKHNLLFFRIGTAEGDTEFSMWWSHDRAQEYGAKGKVLLDAFENRFIIPDVSALPAADRARLTSYIYW